MQNLYSVAMEMLPPFPVIWGVLKTLIKRNPLKSVVQIQPDELPTGAEHIRQFTEIIQ